MKNQGNKNFKGNKIPKAGKTINFTSSFSRRIGDRGSLFVRNIATQQSDRFCVGGVRVNRAFLTLERHTDSIVMNEGDFKNGKYTVSGTLQYERTRILFMSRKEKGKSPIISVILLGNNGYRFPYSNMKVNSS